MVTSMSFMDVVEFSTRREPIGGELTNAVEQAVRGGRTATDSGDQRPVEQPRKQGGHIRRREGRSRQDRRSVAHI